MFRLKFKRRRARLSRTQVALMACSASAIVLLHAVQLCYAEEPAPAAAGSRSGKIESISGNSLYLIVPGADLQTLKVAENAKVSLAGARSKWEDLKKGDFILDQLTLAPAEPGAHAGEGKITLKKSGAVDALTMVFGEESRAIRIRPTTKVDVNGEVVDWAKVQSGSYVVTQIVASKPNQFAYDLSQAKITLNGAPATAKDLRGGD